MLAIFRQRNFALLWSGAFISQVGDWILFAALPFFVYQRTGSTLATGFSFVSEIIPMLLLGSVAGVFVDRWDRKRTMVGADLIRGFILLGLLAVGAGGPIWLVYVVGMANSTVSQFAGPAFNAALPRLVGERDLIPANAALSLGNNLSRLIGPGVGTLMMGLTGLMGVVILDSISFFASAGLIALIVLGRALPSSTEGVDQTIEVQRASDGSPRLGVALKRVWREWRAGLSLIVGERWITVLFIVMGISLLGDSMLTVLLVPFIKNVLGGDAQTFGVVLTARGFGGIVGGLLVGQLGRLLPSSRLIGVSAISLGAILLILLAAPSVPMAIGVVIAAGPAIVGYYASVFTLLQAGVRDEFRGRVFGVFGTTNALMLLIGMTGSSLLGDTVGVVPLLVVTCLLYIASGIVALAVLRPPSQGPEMSAAGELASESIA